MILYPAIDLQSGACVRLKRGDMNAATVYNTDPLAQAKSFAKAGCNWLHVVDLDGAVAGRAVNGDAVAAIVRRDLMQVQLGGGIRDMEAIAYWLEMGVARVVLGTLALREPETVRAACRRWPGRIAVGIDSRNGRVAVEGWAETADMSALDLALAFEDAGVAAIIYTDINRDGMMTGINMEATVELAWALTTPVIASGGVSGMDDLRRLCGHADAGIEGVICGRALYDGRIDPAKAIALLKEA